MESPFRAQDREAIRELIAAYNHYFDAGRLTDFACLFGNDGSLQMGPDGVFVTGSEAIVDFFAPAIDVPGLRHHTMDIIISFSGNDSALVLSHFTVRSPARCFDGTYTDDVVRDDGVWRFARRSISMFDTAYYLTTTAPGDS
jgi:hypothetical protein